MIYETPPSDFKKKHDIVGCFVQHDGKFVLLHRPPHKWSGNQWGLPAGKVDAGETLEEAMCRELQEETGLNIAPEKIRQFKSVAVRVSNEYDLLYHMFSADFDEVPEIRINPHEHDAFRWVTPEESLAMPLVHDQDACTKLFYRL